VRACPGPAAVPATARCGAARQSGPAGPSILRFGLCYMVLGFSTTRGVGAIAILIAHLGGGAQWQTSTFGLQRETPDWIRGRVFAADWGFATLTTAISSLLAGIAADRFGATAATIGVASICVVWAVWWWSWTWKL